METILKSAVAEKLQILYDANIDISNHAFKSANDINNVALREDWMSRSKSFESAANLVKHAALGLGISLIISETALAAETEKLRHEEYSADADAELDISELIYHEN